MHYHTDMITHGTAFGEPVVGNGGDRLITCWKNSTFLIQADRAGLEPGRPTRQAMTQTIVLFPRPLMYSNTRTA